MANTRVSAQCTGHRVYVAAGDTLAQIGQHVGKGDLGGHKGIHRDLGQLRVLQAHSLAGWPVLHDLRVDRFQQLAGSFINLPHQREIGIQEVAQHTPQRDELRAIA